MATVKELTDQYYDLMENIYNLVFSAKQLKEQANAQLEIIENEMDKATTAPKGSDEYIDQLLEFEETIEGGQKMKEKRELESLIDDIYNLVDRVENV